MMKNIASDIYRKRLLLEGFYTVSVDAETVTQLLLLLANELELKTYGEPIVFSPASGMGKDENAGYDAFVPLIDSGISAYIWSKRQFFSLLLYTCKDFDAEKAAAFVRQFFKMSQESELVQFEF